MTQNYASLNNLNSLCLLFFVELIHEGGKEAVIYDYTPFRNKY